MTDTKKILITHDRNGADTFRREVAAAAEAANSLIRIFEAFQPWNKVGNIEDFTALVSDPAQYFDEVLFRNVQINTGGRQANPEVLASLVGIHRPEYLNAVAGLPLTSDDCIPCQRVKVRPGKTAISKRTFENYAEYLTFTGTEFIMNQTAVEAGMSQFDVYATTEQERGVVNDYAQLVETLNAWDKKYYIPDNAKEQLKKTFGLYLSQGSSGHFMMNPEAVIKTIQKFKYSNDGRN